VKLHWSPRSPFVRKVMVFAHEVGLVDRLELTRSPVAMTQPNAALMRDNPLSRIPTLITDDGLALYESTLICEYLDALHVGPKLFPTDPRVRWPALRWHALGEGLLEILILWRNERIRPEAQRSAPIMAGFDAKTRAALDLLEREAVQLAAAPFSIGHIGVACALSYLDFRFADMPWRAGHTQITKWFEGMHARASFQATLPVDE
jgi:glutathione S-transferase